MRAFSLTSILNRLARLRSNLRAVDTKKGRREERNKSKRLSPGSGEKSEGTLGRLLWVGSGHRVSISK